MIIPVKCFTCGIVLADKYRYFQSKVREAKMKDGVSIEKVVYLTKNNIEVKVHYPKNIHEYKIFKKYLKNNTNLSNTLNFSKEILSLPCNHFMSIKHAEFVVNKINRYYESS